jgi:hypothetical protein
MSNSYRQRVDQTIVYLPTNLHTFDEIREEIRRTFVGAPPMRILLTSDDDGHLVISVTLDGAWVDTETP